MFRQKVGGAGFATGYVSLRAGLFIRLSRRGCERIRMDLVGVIGLISGEDFCSAASRVQPETRRLHSARRQSIVSVRFVRGALWPRASDVIT